MLYQYLILLSKISPTMQVDRENTGWLEGSSHEYAKKTLRRYIDAGLTREQLEEIEDRFIGYSIKVREFVAANIEAGNYFWKEGVLQLADPLPQLKRPTKQEVHPKTEKWLRRYLKERAWEAGMSVNEILIERQLTSLETRKKNMLLMEELIKTGQMTRQRYNQIKHLPIYDTTIQGWIEGYGDKETGFYGLINKGRVKWRNDRLVENFSEINVQLDEETEDHLRELVRITGLTPKKLIPRLVRKGRVSVLDR